jgi:2-polyprenyl-3-methyl-5-hydroxy-6-metoxy-1,4-benzoquinol methylase
MSPRADSLSPIQQLQEDEYRFPYHYLDLFPKCAYWFLTERSYRAIVTELLGPSAGRRVLDVGCGDGRLCYELVRAGWDVTGIDYSERAVAYGRAFSDHVQFIAGDVASYQPERTYDALTCVEVLEHIPPAALPNVIVQLRRCLSDDGVLIVSVPSTRIPVTPKHYQHFNPDSLARMLAPHFAVVSMHGHMRMGERRLTYRLLLRLGMFLTPAADKRFTRPYFSLLQRVLRSVERCPAGAGERLIAICRKAPC